MYTYLHIFHILSYLSIPIFFSPSYLLYHLSPLYYLFTNFFPSILFPFFFNSLPYFFILHDTLHSHLSLLFHSLTLILTLPIHPSLLQPFPITLPSFTLLTLHVSSFTLTLYSCFSGQYGWEVRVKGDRGKVIIYTLITQCLPVWMMNFTVLGLLKEVRGDQRKKMIRGSDLL